MTDIVFRLRQISQDMRHDARLDGDARTLREAADEIERLRTIITMNSPDEIGDPRR